MWIVPTSQVCCCWENESRESLYCLQEGPQLSQGSGVWELATVRAIKSWS